MDYLADQLLRVMADSESGPVTFKVKGPSSETKWLTITRKELSSIYRALG